MLAITRKKDQSLLIFPSLDLDPDTTVAELFQNGPIEVLVNEIRGSQVRLGVIAPDDLTILRNELHEQNLARQAQEVETEFK